jgi:hypothetical protein
MGNAGALPNSNFLAGGNFIGGEGSAIDPEAFKRDQRQQKIYNKGIKTDNPNEKEIFLRRTGPQLPLAGIGNVDGLIAQAKPSWQQILDRGTQESWTDIPGAARTNLLDERMPYDPSKNNSVNPLRNYRWPQGMTQPMRPGIRPYFGPYQGPGLQGELGTGAI